MLSWGAPSGAIIPTALARLHLGGAPHVRIRGVPPDRVYFDFAATTPVDPRVVEAMLPYFGDRFGNPSSLHAFGQTAESALEAARQRLADLLGARPEEVIFTSGGSESDNLAVRGVALAEAERRGADRVLISSIEHPAVANAAAFLARQHAFKVDLVPVDRFGRVRSRRGGRPHPARNRPGLGDAGQQ